jgi:hypothetical protein
MNREPEIEFVVSGREGGVEIAPDTIGIARFNEFNRQVQDFLAGAERLDVEHVRVSVQPGSYKLVAMIPALVLAALDPELRLLGREDALGEIDPKRAEVIQKWQTRAKSSPELKFSIRPSGLGAGPIELSSKTDFRAGDAVPWVRVEKYLFGTVMDMGGVQKVNVHLRLENTRETLRIESSQGYLKGNNRLYNKALLRVEAEQNCKTKQLRNIRLISFQDYEQGFDRSALNEFVAEGTKAWADVPDAAGWVRELRGGRA